MAQMKELRELAWYQYLPNILTWMRMAAALAVVVLWELEYRDAAFLVAIVAFVTDVDGWLARLLDCCTKHGVVADPCADKVIVWTVLLLAIPYHSFPWFAYAVPVCVLAFYDVYSVCMLIAGKKGPSIPIAQWKTVVYMVAVSIMLGEIIYRDLIPGGEWLGFLALWVGTAMVAVAGYRYLKHFPALRFWSA